MSDPLVGEPIVEGSWDGIDARYDLVPIGDERLIFWERPSGDFRIWKLDRNATGEDDPFPTLLAKGNWPIIKEGHRLVYVGGDLLLDWQPASGAFVVWPLGAGGEKGPAAQGSFATIGEGHELIYVDQDRMLDWEPATGNFAVRVYDRNNATDPLGTITAQGTWSSIRSGHRLIYMGGEHLLDWEVETGAYRLWLLDRNASGDPLPSLVTEGKWDDLVTGRELVYLDGDWVLVWTPESGDYRIWKYNRSCGE
jgi:hypothetical protein